MKSTKKIALCGVISALSVVLMFLGSVVSIFAYASPIIAGLALIICVKSINKSSAVTVYIAVSLISLFLLPDKESSLVYIFFFGYYPIIKESIDKLNSVIRFALKFIIFNFGIVISQIICVYVFHIPLDNFIGKWGIIILLAMANALFILYDKLMNILIVIYMRKYYTRINHLLR